jgi:hypothetical protein
MAKKRKENTRKKLREKAHSDKEQTKAKRNQAAGSPGWMEKRSWR